MSYKKTFYLKITIIILGALLILIGFHQCFGDEDWYNLIVAISTSIVASFIVSAFFQFSLKDEISKEHHSIMEYLNEKNRSGIIKYYGSFKSANEEIKKSILNTKKVDIYLMYGNTILNSLSDELSLILSKKETTVNIYLMDKENPFLKASASVWSEKNESYTIEKISAKIDSTTKLFQEKINHLKSEGSLNGTLKLFSNLKNPVNYSFYLFDDKIFFVPAKNVSTKEFIPLTLMATKTPESNKNALYNKIRKELDLMLKDNSFKEIDLSNE